MVEVKKQKLIFALTLAPPAEGGGGGSLILKDSSSFAIYTIENPTFDISNYGRGKQGEGWG